MGSDKETIKYTCPQCNGKLENPGTMGGREDKCPLCGFVHPVPLSKSQQKEIDRQRAAEAGEAKAAAIRQQREEAERLRREREEAARTLTPATGASPPISPPPISTPGKRSKLPLLVLAGVFAGAVYVFVLTGASVLGIPVKASEGSLTPTDLEAAKQAAGLWKPTKIGEAYYLYQLCALYAHAGDSRANRTFIELRKPKFFVQHKELSAADKLNGIEWQGAVLLVADMRVRCVYFHTPFGDMGDMGWSETRYQDMISLHPVKKGGQWKFDASEGTATYVSITKADIPK